MTQLLLLAAPFTPTPGTQDTNVPAVRSAAAGGNTAEKKAKVSTAAVSTWPADSCEITQPFQELSVSCMLVVSVLPCLKLVVTFCQSMASVCQTLACTEPDLRCPSTQRLLLPAAAAVGGPQGGCAQEGRREQSSNSSSQAAEASSRLEENQQLLPGCKEVTLHLIPAALHGCAVVAGGGHVSSTPVFVSVVAGCKLHLRLSR